MRARPGAEAGNGFNCSKPDWPMVNDHSVARMCQGGNVYKH
jgi:hypothetical protein